MDWWAILTAILGLVAGTWFGFRISKNQRMQVVPVVEGQQRHIDEAEYRYLDVLRREIANQLMAADAAAMRRAFDKAHEHAMEMKKAGRERQDAEFKALCMKYPSYEQFDQLMTMHFVAYEDATSSMDVDSLVDASTYPR